LKQGDLLAARSYENQRLELYKKWDGKTKESFFLLIAEGNYESCINIMKDDISSNKENKVNKDEEILALLGFAKVWQERRDLSQSQEFLNRACFLSKETGCWHYKDQLVEMAKALNMDIFVSFDDA